MLFFKFSLSYFCTVWKWLVTVLPLFVLIYIERATSFFTEQILWLTTTWKLLALGNFSKAVLWGCSRLNSLAIISQNTHTHSHTYRTHGKITISGPQAEPSAAGMNLVSHFLPTRWHHRALQISLNNIRERPSWHNKPHIFVKYEFITW